MDDTVLLEVRLSAPLAEELRALAVREGLDRGVLAAVLLGDCLELGTPDQLRTEVTNLRAEVARLRAHMHTVGTRLRYLLQNAGIAEDTGEDAGEGRAG